MGIRYLLCCSKSSTELKLSISKCDVKQGFFIFIFTSQEKLLMGCFCCFDYFAHFELSQSSGLAKTGDPQETSQDTSKEELLMHCFCCFGFSAVSIIFFILSHPNEQKQNIPKKMRKQSDLGRTWLRWLVLNRPQVKLPSTQWDDQAIERFVYLHQD